jgi:hypothetical protein
MNDEELHSFFIGLFEVLCPWPPRHKLGPQAEYTPYTEYHWYLAGRAAGLPLLLLITGAITRLAIATL